MRIRRVHIENFRSIKSLDFDPGTYCVLIGENNCGKSNILRALNLALGESWPGERSFTEEDFHGQDTANDIVIQVYFDKVIEDWRNNFKIEIGGIELRCKAYKRAVKGKPAGSLKVEYVCIGVDGKVVSCPAEPLQKGQQFKGQWLPHRVSGDLRESIPFIYVDVLREYDRQNPSSRWSVLRRLFNEVNAEFNSDKTTVKVRQPDGTEVKMTRREAFEQTVQGAYKYLRTERFEEIETRLAANAMEQMGLAEGDNKVGLRFGSHDSTNAFKSLDLYVDQLGISSPAGEVGAGLQSAIVVAIFRTYEELKKTGAIIAIEEPEVFLHPQKARYFAGVLRTLTEKGNQVFLTTHSPVFVQIHAPESVALVRRNASDGTKVSQAAKVELAETDRQALRLLTEFDSQRNEMFFAKKVMLVEGATEKVALPLAFKALGVDINKENLSVIECGGKTKIPLFARVAKALDIPFVILADHDVREIKAEWSDTRKKEQSEKNSKHERWNRDLVVAAGDEKRVFFLRPAFEDEMSLSGDDSQKVDQAFNKFETITAATLPAALRDPIHALLGTPIAPKNAEKASVA